LLLPVGGSWQQGCPRDYLRAKALGVPLGEASVPKTQSSKAALGITFAPAALGVPLGEASVHQGITFALKRSVFPWGRLQFQKRKAARHSFLWQQAAKNKLACFSDLLS